MAARPLPGPAILAGSYSPAAFRDNLSSKPDALRKCAKAVLTFLLLTLFLRGPSAFATVIDFEGFADSTPLTTQIPGLTFANATVITAQITLNEFEFPPHSGTNVAFDDGGMLSFSFSTPQVRVGAFFTYGTALTFEAFDATDTLLGTARSAFSNNEAVSGDPGSSPNEFLSLTFAGISRVRITGDPAGTSFTIDDLTVAEPSTLSLILALTAVAGGLRCYSGTMRQSA